MVYVDPFFNQTAAKADEWIPIRPGTDGAFALALGHEIVKNGWQDEEFIKNYAVGFDKYAELVKDKTPEWAEKVTSVPAATIRRVAQELAATKPALVDSGAVPAITQTRPTAVERSPCSARCWANTTSPVR